VDALAEQGVEASRHGGDKGFPFAGNHFRQASLMDDHPGGELHIKGPKLDGPHRRHAGGAKDFRQESVQGFSAACPASKLEAPGFQFGI
jgi:hypothetical protein